MATLQKKEGDLLALLSEKEAEASRYLLLYESVDREVEALRTDLDGVRQEILDGFLSEHLTPLLLTYTIKTSADGYIVLVVAPQAGGELQYEKFKTSTGLTATTDVPLFTVLSWLGKGIPWSNNEFSFYANS